MKKIIATVIIVLAVMFTPQGVYADSEEQNNEYYDRLISEINEGLSFEGDEDVKTVLEDNNITLEDPSSAANINAFDVIKHIFESFTAALRSPLIMLGKITAATMLCVLVRSMSAEGTVDKVFTLICVLTTVLVISDTVTDSLYSVKTSMEQMNSFMMSYIPIFSSVATAGGSAAAGAGYYGVMLIIRTLLPILSFPLFLPMHMQTIRQIFSCLFPFFYVFAHKKSRYIFYTKYAGSSCPYARSMYDKDYFCYICDPQFGYRLSCFPGSFFIILQ